MQAQRDQAKLRGLMEFNFISFNIIKLSFYDIAA